ncbi:MAG: phosphoglycolate phosphatase [Burkholderiales bacterium]
MAMPPVRAVLFDLDGTLLDTVGELSRAANRMLAALSLPPRHEHEIRDFIGRGTAKLVERCLGGESGRLEEALAIFNAVYQEEAGRELRIYPGVIDGLDLLAAAGMPLGCVTNKPEVFTLPLLRDAGLAKYFSVVVSGDSVARRKPDPMPFTFACSQLGIASNSVLVVGDSANDANAARAAGCRVVCVPYGYREGLAVESLHCDAIVDDVRAAADYVRDINKECSEVVR